MAGGASVDRSGGTGWAGVIRLHQAHYTFTRYNILDTARWETWGGLPPSLTLQTEVQDSNSFNDNSNYCLNYTHKNPEITTA